MKPANIIVSVQREDFCAAQQQRVLLELAAASGCQSVGALATFVGLVRADGDGSVDGIASGGDVRMGRLLALEI